MEKVIQSAAVKCGSRIKIGDKVQALNIYTGEPVANGVRTVAKIHKQGADGVFLHFDTPLPDEHLKIHPAKSCIAIEQKASRKKKFDITDIVDSLPSEAIMQIKDIYCVDEKKEIKDLTLKEICKEVSWVIEKLSMDIDDLDDEYDLDEIKELKQQKKECAAFLKKYKNRINS